MNKKVSKSRKIVLLRQRYIFIFILFLIFLVSYSLYKMNIVVAEINMVMEDDGISGGSTTTTQPPKKQGKDRTRSCSYFNAVRCAIEIPSGERFSETNTPPYKLITPKFRGCLNTCRFN